MSGLRLCFGRRCTGNSSILSYDKGGALSGLSMNAGIERNASMASSWSLSMSLFTPTGGKGCIFLILPESTVMGPL